MTDPIADMLTRIRNAIAVKAKSVDVPHSRVKEAIAQVMLSKNYIEKYEVVATPGKTIVISLKYNHGKSALTQLRRVSKPGRRLYAPAKKLPQSLGGFGIFILTTSQGIMSDTDARAKNAGGEILCEVY